MSAIDTIRANLQEHPNLRWDETGDSITVHPALQDGFPVALYEDGDGLTVRYATWHEEFDSEEEAVAYFWYGLSDYCRLRVISRGSFDYRWIMEGRVEGEWHSVSETGLLLFPFWRRRRERFLQNDFITYDED